MSGHTRTDTPAEANARRLLQHAEERRAELDTWPETITVSGSYACNYRCFMCNLPHGSKDMIAESVVEQVERALPHARMLRLSGGEPLIFPHAARLLTAARAAGARAMIFTNGALLDRCSFAPCEILDEVVVSLDACTAATYEAVRGADLGRVLGNVESLVQERERRGAGPTVIFNFVAMRRNIEELPRLVELASRMGVAAVGCVFLRVQQRELINESLYFQQELSDACMREAREKAAALGIGLQLPALFSQSPQEQQSAGHAHCLEPWKYLEISPQNLASACCAGAGSGKIAPGSTLEEVWNSAAKLALRRTVNTPQEPPRCRSCGFGSVMNPRNPASHFMDAALLAEALQRQDRGQA